jgi:hypothetical protein
MSAYKNLAMKMAMSKQRQFAQHQVSSPMSGFMTREAKKNYDLWIKQVRNDSLSPNGFGRRAR